MTMTPEVTHDRALGTLFGLALGDAMGAWTEFKSVAAIEARYPDRSQMVPTDRVTDDTQMALAVGESIIEAGKPLTAAALGTPLRRAFVAWMNSPDNDRAPGNTCMAACRRLERGLSWASATMPDSKGCGANMRVAPVGLLGDDWFDGGPDAAAAGRAAVAQFQAFVTHGHPTALAASDLTAEAVHHLAFGGTVDDLMGHLSRHAAFWSPASPDPSLGIDQLPSSDDPDVAPDRRDGRGECAAALRRVDDALARYDPHYLRESDPSQFTGGGWVAEEALAGGLLCFLLYPDDPAAAIRRAAVSSGDSDSIACLAGAFAGARHGLSAWPAEWVERCEYADRLRAVAAGIAGENAPP